MEPTLTSKHLITSALRQLASIGHDTNDASNQAPTGSTTSPRLANQNPLISLPQDSAGLAKSALLTLHFLFPFDFLPALDLIDRELVQKLHCQHPDRTDVAIDVFYVQSASAVVASSSRTGSKGGRFGNRNYAATRMHYEVRLDAWNCTCPAFAAATLKLIMGESSPESVHPQSTERQPKGNETRNEGAAIQDHHGKIETVLIGGVATKDEALVPVCKHILAATLCEASPVLFGAGMNVREVTVDELAAWAAGWGET